MRLLTVSTVSYLYQVSVLFSSARHVHPEFKLTVLVSDCTPEAIDPIKISLGSDVEVLCTSDLAPYFDFVEDMRSYYSTLEFCSALKVLGSAYILKKEQSCLFLDPDMIILDNLNEAIFSLPGDLVVSCHTFSPYPIDGESPEDIELCYSGHINGGLLYSRRGLNNNLALDWLVEKTKNQWFLAPELGMYADQQWLTALPYFFRDNTSIVSDRGVNVAYWNLHERQLTRNKDTSKVNLVSGESLRLMHFSGFMIPSNGKISKHTHRKYKPETEKIILDMVSDYEGLLMTAITSLEHLSADLVFSNKPLIQRMKIAANLWNEPQPLLPSARFLSRLRNFF
mgnify:CR=1 FL=1